MNLRLPLLQILLRMLTLAALATSAGMAADPPQPVILVEKPRLAPRPLPGTGTAEDKDKGKAGETPVIPFIPMPELAPSADVAAVAPRPLDMERARILVVRRRGTFKVPPAASPEVAEPAPGDMTGASAPIAIQEPLAEGKFRVIPRALVPPTSPAPPTKP
ncbi:hypothetical protein [Verrucomicrobium sp. BvORR106]|uniref:hypothetical protein n=1 Tax=Verrucomicrobium sp. BvORR106 TaxID=1403819 RepID=UPI00056E2CCE|nr:hypothetical protein [Verrucomicrobium sp. BvORR106]